MRDGQPIDLPVTPPQGQRFAQVPMECLSFRRAFHGGAGALMRSWSDAALRSRWLLPAANERFAITGLAPASLTAMGSDGIHSVRIEAFFEEDAPLTHLRLRITPIAPLTTGILIAGGHADRWEERLYLLADAVTARNDPRP